MTPAALQGTFSDMRIVKGRKVVQLFIEIPMEQADAAIALLGGLPRPDNPVHVAIARLSLPGSLEPPPERPADSSPAGEVAHKPPPPTKRKWSDMRPSQRAALLCQDAQFQMWLREVHDVAIVDPNAPRDWMLERYEIESRSELDDLAHPNFNNRTRKFLDDEHAFFQWRDEQRFGPNPGATVGA